MNNSLKTEEVGSNIKAILDIKDEYTNRFISITRERIKEGYQSIYDNVKENNETPKLILKEFQDKLKLVPVWSEKMIEDEFNRIKIISKCDYLEELIEALFSSYSQMFMIVNNKKFDNPVKIPSHHYVLHNCYIEIARELWRKPQLFYHRYDNQKRQLLNDELNKLIDNSINNSIKKLIPFKELLNNYLDKTNTTIEELDSLKISSNEVVNEKQEDENEEEIDEDEEISDNYEIIDKNELEESINNTENKIIENEDKEELEGLVEDANEETVEAVENIIEEPMIEEPMENILEEELENTDNNNVDITKTLDISLENNETLNEFTNDENGLEEDNIEEEFTLDDNDDDNEDDNDNDDDDDDNDDNDDDDDDDNDDNDDETGIEGDIENSDNTDNQEDTDEIIEEFSNKKENNEENNQENRVDNDYYNNENPNNQKLKINEENLNNNTEEDNIKEVKILSKKDKKHNNEKKIARYLGVNVSVNEFKNNKDQIKKMLLHKSIANV